MNGRPVVAVQVDLPGDIRDRLQRDLEVVRVPSGEAPGPGVPAGWLVDGSIAVDQAMLSRLPGLRVIAIDGVGHDFVDLAQAAAHGVVVTNTAGVVDDAVAELGLALILALGRDVLDADVYCRDGRWRADGPDARVGDEVHGSRVGILGMGRIGSRLAELLAPLRIDVVYHSRTRRTEVEARGLARPLPRDEVLSTCDYVVVLLPSTAQTSGAIGAAELALMRPGARLINLGRGSVVQSAALADALRSGRLAGAALDVMDAEPLPADSPLLGAPRLILQPHVGSATRRTRRAMLEAAVGDLRRGALGLPVRSRVISRA